MSETRKKIPKAVADEVLFRAGFCCCVCGERGDHIHHIDGNPTNSNLDNLVFLCFKHHHEASIEAGLSRRLSPELLKRFRDDWYSKIKVERSPKTAVVDVEGSSDEDRHFQLVTDALVCYDVEKLRWDFAASEWRHAKGIIERLRPSIVVASNRGRRAILDFLEEVANRARDKMPASIASTVNMLSYDCLPIDSSRVPREEPVTDEEVELLTIGVRIAEALIYDGAVKLRDLAVVESGAELLWRIHVFAFLNNLRSMIDLLEDRYAWLLDTLQRPGWPELEPARSLVAIFHGQGTSRESGYPMIPDGLEAKINRWSR